MTQQPRRSGRSLDREILALALPAFATLVAEPLLVIADSAILGHVSTEALAGLGIAASVVGLVLGLSVFLAYGTTSVVARRVGAGDHTGAIAAGLDGLSLAVLIGVVLSAAVGWGAPAIIGLYGVNPLVAAAAGSYLSLVALGFPFALVMLAATGILRGLQDTRTPLAVAIGMNLFNIALSSTLVLGLRWGVTGAAIGTVISQAGAAGVLVIVVLRGARRHQVRWQWRPAGLRATAGGSSWLLLRTLALQLALVTTTAVAATFGPRASAAHQITNSLWMVLVFAMDAIAIAAQAIVGRHLGAGDPETVRAMLRRMLGWASGVGLCTGLLLWTTAPVYLPVFTPDPRLQAEVAPLLPILACLTLIAATVFVLDGVLIGAGDTRYLAGASWVNLLCYLPVVVTVGVTGAGLSWLWVAYGWLTLSRLVTLGLRVRTDRWLRLGA